MYLNFLSAIHYFQEDAVPITLSDFISFLFTLKRTRSSPLFPTFHKALLLLRQQPYNILTAIPEQPPHALDSNYKAKHKPHKLTPWRAASASWLRGCAGGRSYR